MNKELRAAKAFGIKYSIWKIEMKIVIKELRAVNDNLNKII